MNILLLVVSSLRAFRLQRRVSGQFIPLAALIAFSMVMFLLAMVNVYIVARAKLKVQNLADAVALNLASQQAQAYNVVADRNEWLNHMLAGLQSPSDEGAPLEIRNCSKFNAANATLIPGISCIENPFKPPDPRIQSRHIFNSRDGAIGYASVIETVNRAQFLFIEAFNSFLGATAGASDSGALSGPSNFEGLLTNDFPELKDGDYHLVAWNTTAEERDWNPQALADATGDSKMKPKMERLKFRIDHDIKTVYHMDGPEPFVSRGLGELLYGCVTNNPGASEYGKCGPLRGQTPADPGRTGDVGWLVPDDSGPKLEVGGKNAGPKAGVGVAISKTVKLPVLGTKTIMAKAKAYIVEGSGTNTYTGGNPSRVPRFKPTYWVKLAN